MTCLYSRWFSYLHNCLLIYLHSQLLGCLTWAKPSGRCCMNHWHHNTFFRILWLLAWLLTYSMLPWTLACSVNYQMIWCSAHHLLTEASMHMPTHSLTPSLKLMNPLLDQWRILSTKLATTLYSSNALTECWHACPFSSFQLSNSLSLLLTYIPAKWLS